MGLTARSLKLRLVVAVFEYSLVQFSPLVFAMASMLPARDRQIDIARILGSTRWVQL